MVNVEVLAHAIWIIRFFWIDLSVQLMVVVPADGDEGFIAVKSSSRTPSSGSGVAVG